MIYGLKDPLGRVHDVAAGVRTRTSRRERPGRVRDQRAGCVGACGAHGDRGALAATPTARLHTPAEFKADIAGQIDKMLNLIYVLLFLAVVIALFGIANTLALSVVERRRELGLLRAVGMQRSQVRASVRWEAVLIALLGTAVGTALGLGFGWALVKAMGSQGIDQLAIPGPARGHRGRRGVAAVVAAALPARRAARLDVLEAITSS